MSILFEDIFEVIAKDKDGKKFDHVSRFVCKSDLFECDMTLDVNIDVYPLEVRGCLMVAAWHPPPFSLDVSLAHLQVSKKYQVALSNTLNNDGSKGSDKYDASFPGLKGKVSLMDKYEYVMFGKIFKFRDNTAGGQVRVEVTASFGGLLMQLVGDPKKLESLEVDNSIYLLMRKV
jgi:DNA-directed RNA polymerase I, II, and III subunit RPABC3